MQFKMVISQVSSRKDPTGKTTQEDINFVTAPGELASVSLSVTVTDKAALKQFDEGVFTIDVNPLVELGTVADIPASSVTKE